MYNIYMYIQIYICIYSENKVSASGNTGNSSQDHETKDNNIHVVSHAQAGVCVCVCVFVFVFV
jgi:hypothetical protein